MLKLSKKEVFDFLIELGDVFVHFNGTKTKWVPLHLQDREHVVFQFGLDMPVPIPDITTTDKSLSGTLSFSGKPFLCEVPWDAIYAMTCKDPDGNTIHDCVYYDEIPLNVRTTMKSKPIDDSVKKAPVKGQRPQLVKSPNQESAKPLSSKNTSPFANKKRPSHLRLVK